MPESFDPTPADDAADSPPPAPPSAGRAEPAAAPQEAPVDLREQRVASLAKELETARARIDELARAYQANERDKEAFKQRLQREREQLLDVEKGKVALTLLEAVDELDLCLTSADESPLARGVRLIREGLLKKALESGIERVELTGLAYDPNLAEATDLGVVTDEQQDGKVLKVERACYRLGGRVIRPGRVKVAKYVKPAEA